VFQLDRPQRLALSDAVPFCQIATAAGRRGVLRDEYRMSLERRLLAVVFEGLPRLVVSPGGRLHRRERRSNLFFQDTSTPAGAAENADGTVTWRDPRKAGRCPSLKVSVEQCNGRCADHDIILAKFPLKLKPVALPGCVESFRHDLE
jgi:hypothetical protein